ncbi:TrbC/VirB2 family protein (plasmid) [Bacillus sp. RA(2023)]|uniref:Uncharacterized protein n=3 Tax=Bacillus cereus group TaxID=86661 RepID=A0A9X0M8X2_BACCE|nr:MULTISPECIES: TrbC/VirB2 family protein [Bacillus]MCO4220422.1 TrbC/VirB2 family protein [Bacillus sp. 10017]MEB4843031.1 TrbC/VirB2 family protein [Paenibacillus jamilae]EJR25185.1 hypothetical protein IIE_06365 [Bacillus cereus VD045]EKS7877060.1 TrbC/VirB2 family protein [Bacillus cereus]EOO23462.1 hypothetical protein ICC_06073 [Bacillus cereus BAG1X1-1]
MDLFNIFAIKLLTYNDFFDSVSNALTTWSGKLQGLGIVVIVFCVCIIAFMFMFGEGPSRTAKKWLLYVIVGGVLLWGAGAFASTVQGVTSGF